MRRTASSRGMINGGSECAGAPEILFSLTPGNQCCYPRFDKTCG